MTNPDHFAEFLAQWHASGAAESRCATLLPMAKAAGLQFNRQAIKAQAGELGRWLTIQIATPVKHGGDWYEVRRGRIGNGCQFYRVSKTANLTDLHKPDLRQEKRE